MANGPGVADGPPIGFAIPREIKTNPFVQEKSPSIRNPDMKGIATPLERANPGAEKAQNQFEQMIKEAMKQDGQPESLAENLFKNAGVDAKLSPKIPQETKKPQGFWARLTTTIQNFFKDLFR